MGIGDDMKHKAKELKGKAKEGAGEATDNDELEAEGQGDQLKARAKKLGDDVKDAFTDR